MTTGSTKLAYCQASHGKQMYYKWRDKNDKAQWQLQWHLLIYDTYHTYYDIYSLHTHTTTHRLGTNIVPIGPINQCNQSLSIVLSRVSDLFSSETSDSFQEVIIFLLGNQKRVHCE